MGPFLAVVLIKILKRPHNLQKKPKSAHHQRQEKIDLRSEFIKLQICRIFCKKEQASFFTGSVSSCCKRRRNFSKGNKTTDRSCDTDEQGKAKARSNEKTGKSTPRHIKTYRTTRERVFEKFSILKLQGLVLGMT